MFVLMCGRTETERVIRGQNLFRATKKKKLWRVMSAHTLKDTAINARRIIIKQNRKHLNCSILRFLQIRHKI